MPHTATACEREVNGAPRLAERRTMDWACVLFMALLVTSHNRHRHVNLQAKPFLGAPRSLTLGRRHLNRGAEQPEAARGSN
jgi:hypothetical protein